MSVESRKTSICRQNEVLSILSYEDIKRDVELFETNGALAKHDGEIDKLFKRHSSLLVMFDPQTVHFNQFIDELKPRLDALKGRVDFRKGASKFFRPVSLIAKPLWRQMKAVDGLIRGGHASMSITEHDLKAAIKDYLDERLKDVTELEKVMDPVPVILRELDEISMEIPIFKSYFSEEVIQLEKRIEALRSKVNQPNKEFDPNIKNLAKQIVQHKSRIKEIESQLHSKKQEEEISQLKLKIDILKGDLMLISIDDAIQGDDKFISELETKMKQNATVMEPSSSLKSKFQQSLEAVKIREAKRELLKQLNQNTKFREMDERINALKRNIGRMKTIVEHDLKVIESEIHNRLDTLGVSPRREILDELKPLLAKRMELKILLADESQAKQLKKQLQQADVDELISKVYEPLMEKSRSGKWNPDDSPILPQLDETLAAMKEQLN